jgi:hypothetical protein
MKVPDNVINPVLYRKAYNEISRKYGSTSAYRSMALVKRYKELGGKYRGTKTSSKGIIRWLKEQWIQVVPFVTSGKVVACGASNRRKHACRPLKRVSKKTPVTIKEIIKKHGRPAVVRFAKQKQKTIPVRLNWKKNI